MQLAAPTYGTSPVHGIYRLPQQYPRSPLLPSVPTPPHAFFTRKSHSWPWPGAGVFVCSGGSGAGGSPPRPVPPRHTPPHPCHPLRSLQCPRSPVASVQWESRWVIGSRLKILIIHEAGKGLGGVAAGVGVGWGGDESGRAGEQFWEG